MPSSLMARLKAAGGSAPAQASSIASGGGGGRSSHVVTPPPLTTSASASVSSCGASRPASLLAAAAAGRSKDSSLGAATGAKSTGYVPQFKRNPLNANVTASVPEAVAESTAGKARAPAAQAGECKEEKVAADAKADPPKPKSTMQKLLQHTKEPPPVPPAYGMCSQSEALDRQQHLELSPFECDAGSALHGGMISMDASQASKKAARGRPVHNPRCVIKKYRRSAAGGGTLCEASERFPRTIDELSATVDYLLGHIFACQMPPPIEDGDEKDGNADPNEISIWGDDTPVKQRPPQTQRHVPFSLSDTVAFVDDRLRAVQKDLVTLLGNLEEPGSAAADGSAIAKRERAKRLRTKRTAREMQAKMVRYNILASYLLSELPASKYEAKFGARALRTSLTCYLNLSTTLQEECSNGSSQYHLELETQDEIMAYMALLHSSAVIRTEETALPAPASGEVTTALMEDSGSGWGAILSTFCKHAAGSANEYRRWKWALDLACAAQEGNCQRYFALLESGPALPSVASTSDTEAIDASNARFLILARCCASRTLNLVRVAQVRRYNRAFGKLEKVPGKDLARLLQFNDNNKDEESTSSADRAINLCRDAGLPIVKKEGIPNELFVEMKSALIKIAGEEAIRRICNPGRTDDLFVFGSKFAIGDAGAEHSIQDDVGDWEERETEPTMAQNGSHAGGGARTDEDGVIIPSSNVARNLIL